MPVVQYKNVVAESFEPHKQIVNRTWHLRRPGAPMQPTLCGKLFARPGEKATLGKLGPEFVCRECLDRMEVVR